MQPTLTDSERFMLEYILGDIFEQWEPIVLWFQVHGETARLRSHYFWWYTDSLI